MLCFSLSFTFIKKIYQTLETVFYLHISKYLVKDSPSYMTYDPWTQYIVPIFIFWQLLVHRDVTSALGPMQPVVCQNRKMTNFALATESHSEQPIVLLPWGNIWTIMIKKEMSPICFSEDALIVAVSEVRQRWKTINCFSPLLFIPFTGKDE